MDGEDRPRATGRRTTVAEAARLLGISAEAVRGRIRRGTLPVERDGGTVYVLLDPDKADRTTDDQPRTTDDRTGDRTDDRTDLLIAQMQDRIEALEEANRENKRIIAALTQRIPAIEAPEPPESPESPVPAPTLTEASGAPETGAQGTERRSWWSRVFG